MTIPVDIVFKNMERSEFIERRVLREAAKLDRFSDRVMAGHIVIEAENRGQRHGTLYHVGIHLRVSPGMSIDVTHAGRQTHAHEDVYVAIRDAFDAARRQVQQDHARRLAGQVKAHGDQRT